MKSAYFLRAKMKFSKLITFSITLFLMMFLGCTGGEPEPEGPEKVQSENTVEPIAYEGSYAQPDYHKRSEGNDWIGVRIEETGENEISIQVRSRADKKRPTCTWDGKAQKKEGGTYSTMVNGKEVLFSFEEESLRIHSINKEDENALFFFCSGGASFAGEYMRIKGELDPEQVDKTSFSAVLNLQGVGFNVSAMPEGDLTTVTVRPFGLTASNEPSINNIDGEVTGAEVEDLNSDGSPELIIFTHDKKNNTGSVLGFSVNNKKSMSQVNFQPTNQNKKINEGYEGGDEFAVVETKLVQRFPVSGANKVRQVSYTLEEGEAMRQFVVDNVSEMNISE